ncbi:hypothetical protein [Bifidobacterium moraviense]|nr:hypothetical protein [Bifidobacterium sp. DSM 109958]
MINNMHSTFGNGSEHGDAHGHSPSIDDLYALLSGSFPRGDGIPQEVEIAQDLRDDDSAPAPSAEDNAGYADTIAWLREGDTFGDARSIDSVAISQIIREQAEMLLNDKLDYWAYLLVRFAKSQGFPLDERLSRVWLCSQLTGVIRDMLEELAGVALGAGHTLTNIARAGGTSQPNVRTKWPHIRDYADAYRAMRQDGEAHAVMVGDRLATFRPSGSKEYMDRAERILEEHRKAHEKTDKDTEPAFVRSLPARMIDGLKVLTDLADPDQMLHIDEADINGLVKQGDCLWSHCAEAHGEDALRRALEQTVKELAADPDVGTVHGILMTIVTSAVMDGEQMTKDINAAMGRVNDKWPEATYTFRLEPDDGENGLMARVTLLAAGSKS